MAINRFRVINNVSSLSWYFSDKKISFSRNQRHEPIERSVSADFRVKLEFVMKLFVNEIIFRFRFKKLYCSFIIVY